MAQINITLNQAEILQLLSDDKDEAFRELLQKSLNSVLQAESAEQLNAEPYERTTVRTDSRNGVRERSLKTRIGTLTLNVPRHRNHPFKSMIFENYSRSEAALIATMTEMVVNGVSTRKVAKVVETLCGNSFSKSTVSDLCRDLDGAVEEFRNRPLQDAYPFLNVDATYFKVRENGHTVSKALLVAMAYNRDSKREIIGFEVCDTESNETWRGFLQRLKDRGLSGLKIITSDAHKGIIYAISKVFPEVPWQRCQFHFSRNILEDVPKKYQKGLASELTDMFNSTTIEEARSKRDSILDEYRDVAERAMDRLDNGFESAMTVMVLPESIRRFFRTSNSIERMNRELKRRSNVIGIFPNQQSVLRLMGSILIQLNEGYANRHPAVIGKKKWSAIEACTPKLAKIAREQQQLLLAA